MEVVDSAGIVDVEELLEFGCELIEANCGDDSSNKPDYKSHSRVGNYS